MTPEEARALEPGTTPGPWEVHTDPNDVEGTYIHGDDGNMCIDIAPNGHGSSYPAADLHLAAAAPDMRATIAAQTWEWRAEIFEDGAWKDVWEEWQLDEGAAREDYRFITEHLSRTARLVRRPVGPVEVVEE